jgi:citrate lyase subunit beta / citryl-CoA lyase
MRFVRSFLFVPGNQPRMLQKAKTLSCGAVIFDLEDAVGPENKALALRQVHDALLQRQDYPMQVVVRINPDVMENEIQILSGLPFDALLWPKANRHNTARLFECLADLRCATEVLLLIETAIGLVECYQTLQLSEKIAGAMFGAEDFSADMDLYQKRENSELSYARSKIATECVALGRLPIDTPSLYIQDFARLEEEVQAARRLGMKAKAAIHPNQLPFIEKGFKPDEESLARARAIIEIFQKNQGNAFQYEGEMIDKPIISKALRLLELAGDNAMGEGKK